MTTPTPPPAAQASVLSLDDQRIATANAQALADGYRKDADTYRARAEQAERELAQQRAWRTERETAALKPQHQASPLLTQGQEPALSPDAALMLATLGRSYTVLQARLDAMADDMATAGRDYMRARRWARAWKRKAQAWRAEHKMGAHGWHQSTELFFQERERLERELTQERAWLEHVSRRSTQQAMRFFRIHADLFRAAVALLGAWRTERNARVWDESMDMALTSALNMVENWRQEHDTLQRQLAESHAALTLSEQRARGALDGLEGIVRSVVQWESADAERRFCAPLVAAGRMRDDHGRYVFVKETDDAE